MPTLLLTCAGRSTRYPGYRPKWSLTDPSGDMMAAASIEAVLGWDRLVVAVDHASIQQFGSEAIRKEFEYAYHDADIVDVGETRSQVETAARALELANVLGPFTVKDCDNQFYYSVPEDNAVAYMDLHEVDHIIPGNKSYMTKGKDGFITSLKEKEIISPFFCCGAYSFRSRDLFHYGAKDGHGELVTTFLSEVVGRLVEGGIGFVATKASSYVDWGTASDWQKYRSEFKTIFVDVDGVLVESSHRSFPPRWGESPLIQKNIDYLNKLQESGKVYVILTTSRTEEYRDITEKQLDGLNFDRLIMGLPGGARYIVNDMVSSRGERSCYAINLERDSDGLDKSFLVRE